MTTLDPQAAQLLAHAWRGGQFGYLWTVEPGDDGRKLTHWKQASAPPTIPSGRFNVYWGVHPLEAIPERYNKQRQRIASQHIRASIADVSCVNVLFSEFDAKDFGDKQATLKHVETLTPSPSVVADSGGGYHAYWLLRETFVIATDADRERVKRIQARWVDHTGGDAAAKDLARVLRVPGTRNYKSEYAPDYPRVAIVRADFTRLYALDEIEALLPAPTLRQPAANMSQPANGDKYATAAFMGELSKLRGTANGDRNNQLFTSSARLGQFVAGGLLSRDHVEQSLYDAARACGLTEHEVRATIRSGLRKGELEPIRTPIQ